MSEKYYEACMEGMEETEAEEVRKMLANLTEEEKEALKANNSDDDDLEEKK